MRICTKCDIEKSLDKYSKSKKNKLGLRAQCKECDRNYRLDNSKSIKDYQKKYSLENRENSIKYLKNYRVENRKYLKEKAKYNRIRDVDIIKLRSKKYYKENKKKLLEKSKKYYKENKKEIVEKGRIYRKEKRNNDPLFKLECNIRRLILHSFSKNITEKSLKTKKILGCSIQYFKNHLESKFEPWMNWQNRGLFNGKNNYGWDLDHIVPISSAKTKEELIKLNHYSNFQPLCGYINRCVKKDKT